LISEVVGKNQFAVRSRSLQHPVPGIPH